ncbi:MAG: hypothetical protein EPO36_00855 [Chloroflexota bacterium]|nr:MAG: hypothetical protein EPO36_00855 [Chloroflexota bacterium]
MSSLANRRVPRAPLVLAALLVTASGVGIASGGNGFYASYPAVLAGMVGQDVVSLLVAVPLLLLAARSAARGSVRGTLILAGILFYLAYGYSYYVLGGFNALFPVYIAIVAVSLYALLALLVGLDPMAVATQVQPGLPRRIVAGFQLGVGLLFVVMWGGMIVSLIASNKQPDPVPHGVVALDGMILLPALLIGGWLLWRAAAWGFALGAILLTKLALTGGTLAFTTALSWVWSGAIDDFNLILLMIFGAMAVIATGLAVPYLRHIGDGPIASLRLGITIGGRG